MKLKNNKFRIIMLDPKSANNYIDVILNVKFTEKADKWVTAECKKLHFKVEARNINEAYEDFADGVEGYFKALIQKGVFHEVMTEFGFNSKNHKNEIELAKSEKALQKQISSMIFTNSWGASKTLN